MRSMICGLVSGSAREVEWYPNEHGAFGDAEFVLGEIHATVSQPVESSQVEYVSADKAVRRVFDA